MPGKTLRNVDKTRITLRPDFDVNQAARQWAAEIIPERSRQRLVVGSGLPNAAGNFGIRGRHARVAEKEPQARRRQ